MLDEPLPRLGIPPHVDGSQNLNLRKIATTPEISEDELMPDAVSGGIGAHEWKITPAVPPLCRLKIDTAKW